MVVGTVNYESYKRTNNEYKNKHNDTSGYMKFDGTTFTITDLDKDTFGADEFHLSLPIRSSVPIKVSNLFQFGHEVAENQK